MKLRIFYSDGVFRGGLFKTEVFSPLRHRTWWARPHPHYRECMIDTSGHGEPSDPESWMIVQYSMTPSISGPEDGSDPFDENSLAISVTPREALRWFRAQVYEPPADLVALAREQGRAGIGSTPAPEDTGLESEDAAESTLPDGQREVWDLLDGKAMSTKELARALGLGMTEDAVRKRVQEIRLSGRTIVRDRVRGYYRADAPPEDIKASQERDSREAHGEGTAPTAG